MNSVTNFWNFFFFVNKEFFCFLHAKLGHFIINDFFLYVTNTQTKQQKLENVEKNVL